MKIENPVDVIEQIDFCQSRPVFIDGGYLMVRNVRNAASKDAVSKTPLTSDKLMKRWFAAIGMGGVSLTGGVPVAQSYYGCALRNSKGQTPLDGVFDEYALENKFRGMNRCMTAISEETRYSFWLAFGILPDEQIQLEQYYDSLELSFGNKKSLVLDSHPIWGSENSPLT